jgi:sarcosine oxidase subunit gamma
VLAGDGALDVLAQVCNVNFGALDCAARPVIMTLMIGVAVLMVPQGGGANGAAGGGVQYRIWCDPTFGEYLEESVGAVVRDCGGSHGGVSA